MWWAKILLYSLSEEDLGALSRIVFSDSIPKLYNYTKIAVQLIELEWKAKLKSEPIEEEEEPEKPPKQEIMQEEISSSRDSRTKSRLMYSYSKSQKQSPKEKANK